MKKLELFWPIKNAFISQRFGECDPRACEFYRSLGLAGHNGLDIPCLSGTPVYAAHDGVVTFAGQDGAAGWGVVVRTEEEFEYNGGYAYFKTIYWHLRPDIVVKAGQRVMIGDLLGYADNTGYSLGPHLHFGLKPMLKGEFDWTWSNVEQQNGYHGAIDPEPFLDMRTAYALRTTLQILFEIVLKMTRLIEALRSRR